MTLRWVRRAVVLVLVAAAIVALRLTYFKPDPVPVTVFRAARGRVEETVTNSRAGSIRSRRHATLSPEIGGRVEALPVKEGDRVRKGAVLVRLADADYRAQIDLQQRSRDAVVATANEACQAAELAARELARSRSLASDGLLSPQLLDQLQSRHETAISACEASRARARQAEAAVKLARVSLAKTVMRAPFDGVVAEMSTEVGEWVTPSPPGLPIPPVVELIDTTAIYVSAPLDEVDIAKVHVGQPVRITLDAFPGQAFSGRLTKIAPYVVDRLEQNRTFEVEVEFDDRAFASTLRPGVSADVEVILAARPDVLRVPSYALIEGTKVMVARSDVLAAIPVKTGLKNWDFTEIVEGLSPGDLVVVSLDRIEVREGAKVRVERETAK